MVKPVRSEGRLLHRRDILLRRRGHLLHGDRENLMLRPRCRVLLCRFALLRELLRRRCGLLH